MKLIDQIGIVNDIRATLGEAQIEMRISAHGNFSSVVLSCGEKQIAAGSGFSLDSAFDELLSPAGS